MITGATHRAERSCGQFSRAACRRSSGDGDKSLDALASD